MDQNGSFPWVPGGCASSADSASTADELSGVDTREGLGAADREIFRSGFAGSAVLQNGEALTEEETGTVLVWFDHLSRWAQAQQARIPSRAQDIYQDETFVVTGKPDRGTKFSIAADEAATIPGAPAGTGKAFMSQAGGTSSCLKKTGIPGSGKGLFEADFGAVLVVPGDGNVRGG